MSVGCIACGSVPSDGELDPLNWRNRSRACNHIHVLDALFNFKFKCSGASHAKYKARIHTVAIILFSQSSRDESVCQYLGDNRHFAGSQLIEVQVWSRIKIALEGTPSREGD